MPLDALGETLTSVSDNDMAFDEVRAEFGDREENQLIASEDDHADNRGGPVPNGSWQFAMHSVAKPMNEVKADISDPRGDLTFGSGEEFFAAVDGQMSYGEALERFPLSYSKFVKAQAGLESSLRTVVRRHPELFVIIDRETPADEGVLIARLSWDKDLERSEDELRRIGREGQVETQRCSVESLAETLERMA